MKPRALDRHEADLARRRGLGNVEHRHSRRPVARCAGHMRAMRAGLRLVVVALVRHLGLREHVAAMDEQQEIVMDLQMQAPCVGRVLDIGDGLRVARIAHVDHRKALRADMADIGVAVPHHDLLAVGAAGLIGMPDQAHVPRIARLEVFGARSSPRLSPCIRRCRGRR